VQHVELVLAGLAEVLREEALLLREGVLPRRAPRLASFFRIRS
jgi:hypothetical protein